MTALEFDKVLARRLEMTKAVLGMKAGEYASDVDRLHNFKLAATISHCTPAEALRGMMVKHWVSIMDLLLRGTSDPAVLDEKIGDAINYLILLEALLREGRT